MEWEIWKPWYEKIAMELDIDVNADEEATRLLNSLLPDQNMDDLRALVKDKECVVFGAGPSLEGDILKLKTTLYKKTVIAADGATTAVMEHRVPDIIVTDLDGKLEDQMDAWKRGAWMVIHAHGDNIPRVREIAPKLDRRVVGTTQVRPMSKVYNFGGFTDGDRAAFMAHEFGAKVIYLAGMDLGTEVGKFSGRKDPAKKTIKLKICGELLSWLDEDLGAPIVNLTGSRAIPHIRKARC